MRLITTGTFFGLFIAFLSITGCSNQSDDSISQWPVNNSCDLHSQACTSKSGDAEVSLQITPKPIPVARPLAVEVKTKNLDIKKIELDISGVNMYMGFNRAELTAEQPGTYKGKTMLAFCTTKEMVWQVAVIIHLKDGSQLQVPYELVTINKAAP